MWETFTYYATLLLESLVGIVGIRLYEEPRYEVIERIGERIEIRRYGERLAAEAEIADAGEAGRGRAFELLFNYIAGANAGSGKIAMTAPVALRERVAMTAPVEIEQANGKVRMQFFLPGKYSLANAPEPSDSRVRLVALAAETIATLRFSGSGRDYAARQSELLARLAGSRWRAAGTPYALNYDAPITLPFLRRNEAAVAVRASD